MLVKLVLFFSMRDQLRQLDRLPPTTYLKTFIWGGLLGRPVLHSKPSNNQFGEHPSFSTFKAPITAYWGMYTTSVPHFCRLVGDRNMPSSIYRCSNYKISNSPWSRTLEIEFIDTSAEASIDGFFIDMPIHQFSDSCKQTFTASLYLLFSLRLKETKKYTFNKSFIKHW